MLTQLLTDLKLHKIYISTSEVKQSNTHLIPNIVIDQSLAGVIQSTTTPEVKVARKDIISWLKPLHNVFPLLLLLYWS